MDRRWLGIWSDEAAEENKRITIRRHVDGGIEEQLVLGLDASSAAYHFLDFELPFPSPSSSSQLPPQILYIYTCPPASKIKDRMMYSTSKTFTRYFAEQNAGLVIAKSLEASDPSEISEQELAAEFGGSSGGQGADAGEKVEAKGGFARPKRPGRR